ncbi:hypothetical protein WN51_06781 [Melipona quadrifasciata]|uniref:Uncharacterized protein n=1 Tax=Melipona quadrifasciata TaxID=166423 RepID=A0A0M8ZTK9_9HYME|nr:hypothetical protein WN51_06781 [Melipona quadrifasciata]
MMLWKDGWYGKVRLISGADGSDSLPQTLVVVTKPTRLVRTHPSGVPQTLLLNVEDRMAVTFMSLMDNITESNHILTEETEKMQLYLMPKMALSKLRIMEVTLLSLRLKTVVSLLSVCWHTNS